MTWAAVLQIILQLFGPVLVEWLRKLLEDAMRETTHGPSSTSGFAFTFELADLFDRARGKLWWWQFGKKAAVRLAERAVLARADEVRLAALGHNVALTPLSESEKASLWKKV